MKTIEFEQMSINERLQCLEDLWDSLSHAKPEIKSPDWHKEILINRRDKIKSGTAKFYTIEQIKKLYRK